jgi:hypothetical protein
MDNTIQDKCPLHPRLLQAEDPEVRHLCRTPRMKPSPSEITPQRLWLDRRQMLALTGAALAGPVASASDPALAADDITPREAATRHNNYYEFSPDKAAVWKLAEELRTTPWTVTVDGARSSARAVSTSTTCCAASLRKTASTGCAASRAGRWWCRGAASRSPRC